MPSQLCVACGKALVPAGKLMSCICGGAWIAEATLVEMAQEIRGPLVKLPWRARAGETRACPMCRAAMEIVALEGVVLDRCAPHGVWFDAHELGAVLERIRLAPARRITPVMGSRVGMPATLDRRTQAHLLGTLYDLSELPGGRKHAP